MKYKRFFNIEISLLDIITIMLATINVFFWFERWGINHSVLLWSATLILIVLFFNDIYSNVVNQINQKPFALIMLGTLLVVTIILLTLLLFVAVIKIF